MHIGKVKSEKKERQVDRLSVYALITPSTASRQSCDSEEEKDGGF